MKIYCDKQIDCSELYYIIDLTCQKEVCLMKLRFKVYFSHHWAMVIEFGAHIHRKI